MKTGEKDSLTYRAAALKVLCDGLRPEAHGVMDIVLTVCGNAELMSMVALIRRILDNYDIAAPMDEFIGALRAYVTAHMEDLKFAFRKFHDPDTEAFSALAAFFIITHKQLVVPIEHRRAH